MRFYNQFLSLLLSCLVILACHFSIGTRCTFCVVAWLRGSGGGLKFPAGTENVTLQMAPRKRSRYGVAKNITNFGPMHLAELSQSMS